MADKVNIDPENPAIPPEAIAFASRMYDAARAGQLDIFEQALPAGLPANLTNEKGDSLVCSSVCFTMKTFQATHLSMLYFISRRK